MCFGVLLFAGCSGESNSKVLESEALKEVLEEKLDKALFESISAKKFKSFTDKITKRDKKNVILDVRTLQEFNDGHIKNAKMLDFYKSDFAKKLSKLDKTKRYFIYCHSGNRSGQTLQLMKKMKFQQVYNLKYGMNDWHRNNFSLIK